MPFQKVEFEFPDVDKPENKPAVAGDDDVEVIVEGQPADKPKNASSKVEQDNDVEIEVVDDEPPEDKGRTPMSTAPDEVTEEELEGYSKKVRKRLAHFSKGYHDKRREAENAQRERQAAVDLAEKLANENKKLKLAMSKNQEALLEQAKKAVTSELEQAKSEYKKAYEAGDADKLVAAQETLTATKFKAEQLATIRPPSLQEEETNVQPEITAPTPSVDRRSLDWQQVNPWFGPDDEMTSFALGVHTRLVKQGYNPQSEEYYAAIDRRMREVFPDKFDNEDSFNVVEASQSKARKANVVAPVTRSTAPKKIVLSKTQVALAKRLGVPLKLYAEQVAEELRRQNG